MLGHYWYHLGPSWGHVGVVLALRWEFGSALGALWARSGAHWGALGRSCFHFAFNFLSANVQLAFSRLSTLLSARAQLALSKVSSLRACVQLALRFPSACYQLAIGLLSTCFQRAFSSFSVCFQFAVGLPSVGFQCVFRSRSAYAQQALLIAFSLRSDSDPCSQLAQSLL